MLFKIVMSLLVLYVVALGLIPAIVIGLMGKTKKNTSGADVPLTESQSISNIESKIASSTDFTQVSSS